MFNLRQYQIDLIDLARDKMRQGYKSILIQAPTGAGKTALTAFMIKTAAEKGKHALFINHRRELIKQSSRTFGDVGVRHGIIAADFSQDLRHRVQIAGIQTLVNRYHKIHPPDLVIWDECHHLGAASWSKIFRAFPSAIHIGLSASPVRLDGKGLGTFFQVMIESPSMQWLIENNFLSKYRIFAPPGVNTNGLHTRMGDFVKSEMISLVDKPTITGDAIKHYRKHADRKRAVVFCASIEHSEHVVRQFTMAGYKAAHVDGETPMTERDSAIERFKSGDIEILSNVDLFGEGFDLPAMEVAILLRPTQSLGLYLQQVGRALRTSPGKAEAIILDHVGNVARHGLPDDERTWSLDGIQKQKSNQEGGSIKVKICPRCYGAAAPGPPACSFCGFIFETKPREIKNIEGELEELDPNLLRQQRKIEQGRADSLEALTELGRKRGYKHPRAWAQRVFQARQAKRLRGF